MRSLRFVHGLIIAGVGAGLAGCPSLRDVPCNSDADCDLASGGTCIAAASGTTWCAFSDSACDSGLRYSNDNVGDGVGGTCTGTGGGSGSNAPGMAKLTVRLAGSGTGAVSGDLACATGTCDRQFPMGTHIHLDAAATTATFRGWTDGCAGTAGCDLVLDADRTVGALFGTAGELLWLDQIGGAASDTVTSVAPTRDGHLIVIGTYEGQVTFGTTPLDSGGSNVVAMFVAKVDAFTGAFLWARSFEPDIATRVAVDAADNIYLFGAFLGIADFGGGHVLNAVGQHDAFVAKLDAQGACAWVVAIGGAGAEQPYTLSLSPDQVAVSGTFDAAMTVNATTFTPVGGVDAFVVSLNLDGTFRWKRAFGGTGSDVPTGLVIDKDDNVVVAGTFGSSVDFGLGALAAIGQDMFLAKYAGATGVPSYAKRFGNDTNTSVGYVGLTADFAGNLYVAPNFFANLDLGNGAWANASTHNPELLVGKMSSAGINQWEEGFPGGGGWGFELSAPKDGSVYVTGQMCGSLNVNGNPLAGHGCTLTPVAPFAPFAFVNYYDAYEIKLRASTGAYTDAFAGGSPGQDAGYAIRGLDDSRVVLGGTFTGSAMFLTKALTAAGYDGYLGVRAP